MRQSNNHNTIICVNDQVNMWLFVAPPSGFGLLLIGIITALKIVKRK